MGKMTGVKHTCKEIRNTYRVSMAAGFAVIVLLTAAMVITSTAAAGEYRKLTYSVYPYLPDVDYYAEVLEEEWEKLHPEISLEYVPYDCYFDGRPEGIDVIMYDVIMERTFIEKGYIRPFEISDFMDTDDYYPFTLEPAAGYAENFGIPVFLCCDLLIYDRDNRDLSEADDIFDAAASDSKLLISFASYGDHIYLLDAAVDQTQDPEVIQYKDRTGSIDVTASRKALADAAIPEYTDIDSNEIALLYDTGAADGYLGYAETMRFLNRRLDRTEVKQISIGQNVNIPLFYCDMAGISADVPDDKTGLCRDLIGIMTDTEVMKRISLEDGSPQYLMFPRILFYRDMEKEYPMYARLREVVSNENNRLFRVYGSFMEETYGMYNSCDGCVIFRLIRCAHQNKNTNNFDEHIQPKLIDRRRIIKMMNANMKLKDEALAAVNGGAIHFISDPEEAKEKMAEEFGPYEVIDDFDGTVVCNGIWTLEDAKYWARVFNCSEELI